jgi:hypothetical protein
VPTTRSAAVRPLSPDRYRYQLTIGGATLEKLRFAKDLLRHALPSADDEAVLDRALGALIAELVRRKVGAGRGAGSSPAEKSAAEGAARPSATAPVGPGRGPGADSREIPAAVKRTVWARDLGRCAFVGADGHRCGTRAFVEFHHVRPYAVGGEPTVDNVQLRCRRHNGYEACVFFARGVDEGAPGPALAALARTSARTDSAAGGRGLDRSRTHADRAGRSGTSARGRDARSGSRARDGAGTLAGAVAR